MPCGARSACGRAEGHSVTAVKVACVCVCMYGVCARMCVCACACTCMRGRAPAAGAATSSSGTPPPTAPPPGNIDHTHACSLGHQSPIRPSHHMLMGLACTQACSKGHKLPGGLCTLPVCVSSSPQHTDKCLQHDCLPAPPKPGPWPGRWRAALHGCWPAGRAGRHPAQGGAAGPARR